MISESRAALFSILWICIVGITIAGGGCSKPKDPAIMTLIVEGQEFSDAQVLVDGKAAGRFLQTIISPNGDIRIDGLLQATLPPREPEQQEDSYSGSLDSVLLPPGNHAFTYLTQEGKRLEFTADVTSGYHLITYLADEEKVKWNGNAFKVVAGQTLALKAQAKGR